MAIVIKPYTEELIPAVKAFNRRLAAGGLPSEFYFPESNIPHWLPKMNGRRIYQEYYVAIEGEHVRGAFILKYQDFFLKNEIRPVAFFHLPVSEGTVDKAFASAGVHMLRSAIKMAPMLFALGMGGFDRPLPQMLKAMGWNLCAIPFYFRVNHPMRFLRQLAFLRKTSSRRLFADLAAFTGAGWAGIKAAQAARTRSPIQGVTAEPIESFDSWADELWTSARTAYAMVATRDRSTLNVLYPAEKNFIRLRICKGPQILGWAVVIDTLLHQNEYFGNLRLGSIADCFALPANSSAVVQAATRFLEMRGIDLTISNQSHKSWTESLSSAGFFKGPSNFLFGASKSLTEALVPFDANRHQIFLNRGDGDGPVNL